MNEIKEIASQEDKSCEIASFSQLQEKRFPFGKIVATKEENDFLFISLNSPIEQMRLLLAKKYDEFPNSKINPIEIIKYIFEDNVFIQTLTDSLENIANLYEGYLPCEIENFGELKMMINHLRMYSPNDEIYNSLSNAIKNIYLIRSVDFNGKRLSFADGTFDIHSVDILEGNLDLYYTLKIQNIIWILNRNRIFLSYVDIILNKINPSCPILS